MRFYRNPGLFGHRLVVDWVLSGEILKVRAGYVSDDWEGLAVCVMVGLPPSIT